MLSRLADRLILRPTRHTLDTQGKLRRIVKYCDGAFELWNPRGEEFAPGAADVYILKFGGVGSRAERATEHPAEVWEGFRAEVWALNPPGYGGSPGEATLRCLAAVADAAYSEIRARARNRPVVLTGNSLGGALALYVAARHQIEGLILRNPPPLRQMIVRRYGWWNGFVGAALIARQTPCELDSIANAARCHTPAVFLASGRDRVVPLRFQRLIHQVYAGDCRILNLPKADHGDPLQSQELAQYHNLLHWLGGRLMSQPMAGQQAQLNRK